MSQKVNIYSAVGCEGGSTVFFRDLTNKLNEAGYDATFYSPQKQTACKSAVLSNTIDINQPDNVVISHLIPTIGRVNAKRKILSSHEMSMGSIADYFHDFDCVHFVSEHQREWHKISTDYKIIPPFIQKIKPNYVEGRNIGAIISHIHTHKQIHKAVELAIKDKVDQFLIYGGLSNQEYFYKEIWPLLDGMRVKYCGPCYNKQEMFDSFDVLYSTSISETYSLTISEAIAACKTIRVEDDCNYLDIYREFDDEVLLTKWKNLIEGEVK